MTVLALANSLEWLLYLSAIVLIGVAVWLYVTSRSGRATILTVAGFVCLIFGGVLFFWTGTHFYVAPNEVALIENFRTGELNNVVDDDEQYITGLQQKPFQSRIHTYPIGRQNMEFNSTLPDPWDSIVVIDNNGLTIPLDINIAWRIQSGRVDTIYRNGGMAPLANDVRTIIRATVPEAFQATGLSTMDFLSLPETINTTSDSLSVEEVEVSRERLRNKISDRLAPELDIVGVELIQILLRNVNTNDEIERNISARFLQENNNRTNMEATQGALDQMLLDQGARSTAQSIENDRLIEQAGAHATATAIAVDSEANNIRLIGEAKAEALQLEGEQLAQFPGLIEYERAQAYDGSVPNVYFGGGGVPNTLFTLPLNMDAVPVAPTPNP